MKDVTLAVLVAGMGSRYGGLKQIDPIGSSGEIVLEMPTFDAIRAGFSKIISITRKVIGEDFKRMIGDKVADHIKVEHVPQEMGTCLSEGYEIPVDRVRSWGAAHTILCRRNAIHEPFAIINADDYYGIASFQKLHDCLVFNEDETVYSVVGFAPGNTLTDHGSVACGVCEVGDSELASVDKRTGIRRCEDKIQYHENDTWYDVGISPLVSMNMWGFTPKFMEEMEERFLTFLQEAMKENPLKSKFHIPVAVDMPVREGKAIVTVSSSDDKWHGIAHQEDRPMVKEGVRKLIGAGKYPIPLWSK